MRDYPKDYYYSIEAGGEFSEGHLLVTDKQAAALERAIKARLVVLGYNDFAVQIDEGGEYDYAYDEEDDDFDGYAAAIVHDKGFTIQPGSTLKEEE